jgi:hypothetical protein
MSHNKNESALGLTFSSQSDAVAETVDQLARVASSIS